MEIGKRAMREKKTKIKQKAHEKKVLREIDFHYLREKRVTTALRIFPDFSPLIIYRLMLAFTYFHL